MSLAASLPSPDRKFCPSLWEGALGELPRGATLLVSRPGRVGRVLDTRVLTSQEQCLALPMPQFPLEADRRGLGQGKALC